MNEEQRKEKLDELKKQPIPELIAMFRTMKDEYDELKAKSSAINEVIDMIRLVVLPEKMDSENVSTMTVPGAGRVSLQGDLYFSIPSDSREDCYEWLREHGHGDIIQETVNSSTGKAWAKEMMKSGQTIPELFKVTPFTRATLTRVK